MREEETFFVSVASRVGEEDCSKESVSFGVFDDCSKVRDSDRDKLREAEWERLAGEADSSWVWVNEEMLFDSESS